MNETEVAFECFIDYVGKDIFQILRFLDVEKSVHEYRQKVNAI